MVERIVGFNSNKLYNCDDYHLIFDSFHYNLGYLIIKPHKYQRELHYYVKNVTKRKC
ncbi:hypothetical protein Hanom_Chr12g01171371 [Helianthus anomalus]